MGSTVLRLQSPVFRLVENWGFQQKSASQIKKCVLETHASLRTEAQLRNSLLPSSFLTEIPCTVA